MRIQTPTLREIAENIRVLANHFLAKHCALLKTQTKQFTSRAIKYLSDYSWPGNARQLENEIKRGVRKEKNDRGRPVDLPAERAKETSQEKDLSYEGKTIDQAVERRMIEEALRKAGGNKQKAAQALGLSRQGLLKKIKRLAITA